MRVTTSVIAASISRTIDDKVLPDAPSGWPASYLRSAVMLLTYLEDLARLEPEILREDNRELSTLLNVGASALEALDADPTLPRRLRDAASEPTDDATANETRRAALCELIVAAYHWPGARPPAVTEILDAIAAYRERSLARDDEVWRRAEALPLM